MGTVHGIHHDVFGQLVGATFNHADRVGGTGNNQVELGDFHLGTAGVYEGLTLNQADPNTRDGALKGSVRDVECCRSTAHGEGVRIGGLIVRENGTDHLGLVAVVLRELRANRTVNHPRDEGLALVGAALTLEVVSRNGAVSTVAILVLNCERQEVEAGWAAGNSSHEDSRVAHADDDSAVGLLGHKAGFKSHGTSADFDGYRLDFHWVLQIHECRLRSSIRSQHPLVLLGFARINVPHNQGRASGSKHVPSVP